MDKNIPLAIKTITGALAAAFALSFSLTANADGFYIDLGLGQATLDFGKVNTTGLNIDDTDTSYSIGAGYKFNNNIAIEGGYVKLGTVSINASADGSTLSASSEFDGFYLGPVLSLPMGDKFEAYARAGVYFWNADNKVSATGFFTGIFPETASDSGNDPYYGIGAAFKAAKNISVGADWTRYSGTDVDIDVIGARLKFAF